MPDESPAFHVNHPALQLRIKIDPGSFDPLAAMLLTASVEVEVPHPTGRFAYSASDVTFLSESVERFASELATLAREGRGRARLVAVADALWVEVGGEEPSFRVDVGAEEPSVGAGHGALRCGARVPWDAVIELDKGVKRVASTLRGWQEDAA